MSVERESDIDVTAWDRWREHAVEQEAAPEIPGAPEVVELSPPLEAALELIRKYPSENYDINQHDSLLETTWPTTHYVVHGKLYTASLEEASQQASLDVLASTQDTDIQRLLLDQLALQSIAGELLTKSATDSIVENLHEHGVALASPIIDEDAPTSILIAQANGRDIFAADIAPFSFASEETVFTETEEQPRMEEDGSQEVGTSHYQVQLMRTEAGFVFFQEGVPQPGVDQADPRIQEAIASLLSQGTALDSETMESAGLRIETSYECFGDPTTLEIGQWLDVAITSTPFPLEKEDDAFESDDYNIDDDLSDDDTKNAAAETPAKTLLIRETTDDALPYEQWFSPQWIPTTIQAPSFLSSAPTIEQRDASLGVDLSLQNTPASICVEGYEQQEASKSTHTHLDYGAVVLTYPVNEVIERSSDNASYPPPHKPHHQLKPSHSLLQIDGVDSASPMIEYRPVDRRAEPTIHAQPLLPTTPTIMVQIQPPEPYPQESKPAPSAQIDNAIESQPYDIRTPQSASPTEPDVFTVPIEAEAVINHAATHSSSGEKKTTSIQAQVTTIEHVAVETNTVRAVTRNNHVNAVTRTANTTGQGRRVAQRERSQAATRIVQGKETKQSSATIQKQATQIVRSVRTSTQKESIARTSTTTTTRRTRVSGIATKEQQHQAVMLPATERESVRSILEHAFGQHEKQVDFEGTQTQITLDGTNDVNILREQIYPLHLLVNDIIHAAKPFSSVTIHMRITQRGVVFTPHSSNPIERARIAQRLTDLPYSLVNQHLSFVYPLGSVA